MKNVERRIKRFYRGTKDVKKQDSGVQSGVQEGRRAAVRGRRSPDAAHICAGGAEDTARHYEYLLDRRRLSAIMAINSLLVGFPRLF